jgi:perosamine synthetase
MVRLTRPLIGEEEIDATTAVLRSGMLVQGERVAEFEQLLAERCGRKHAVAVSSGTAALQLSLWALEIGPGDEVLCPALSWPSPAHAIAMAGATPVLVDVDPREWNSTPDAFQAARTGRTRAAIAIDQFGFPARVEEIAHVLGKGIPVIEDAACAIGSSLDGEPCGSFGTVSCLSFHPRKVITTAEGGACLTDDAALADRLRVRRNHGQRTAGAFEEAAPNFRLTDLAAALGVVQLGRLEGIVAARQQRAARYRDAFTALEWQQPLPKAEVNYQTMGALLPMGTQSSARDAVVRALKSKDVEAGVLSFALHQLPSLRAAADHARANGIVLKNAESIADRGLSLPLFPSMSDGDQEQVIRTFKKVLEGSLS